MFNLGYMHERGLGMKQVGMFNLGYMYERGLGMKQVGHV